MQADGRFIQHVQRVHQVRTQRVRERDALCLAARQGTGLTVEREIPEADVVHESDPGAQLAQDVIGDLLLKRRELKILQPAREVGSSQRCGFSDRFAGHADRERLGFESRATTSGARLGELVLAEKHPDVLLVALFLEPLEERKHPEVAAFLVLEQKLPVARRNVFPAHIQANAACPGGLA